MQSFYHQIGVQDIYYRINQITFEVMDKTYIRGSKYIDLIAVLSELIEFIDNCILVETNNIIITNYWACITEINISEYFNKMFSK